MAKTKETARFLEEALRATYVTMNFYGLKSGKMYVDDLATEEGREPHKKHYKGEKQRLEDQGSTNIPYYQVVLDVLRDLDDPEYVTKKKGELQQETAKYIAQRRAWTGFISEHRNILGYLATLASGSRKKVETPSEEVVFETLRRLSGNMIIGELGAGAETLEATLILDGIVKTAAYKHAQRIGEEPQAYYSKITVGKKDTLITL